MNVDTQKGVALVGMAGRFPGAENPRQLWRNLLEGRESVSFATDEELAAAGFDESMVRNPDFVRAASRIASPEYFDAEFFGFSAREAEITDPQQRIFLECAWEALEDAAYDPGACPGTVGVFAGEGLNTYGALNLMSHPDLIASVGAYQVMLANDKDFLATRVAYKLDLRGPAIGVQTGCSTSLVAVQMAFESLMRKECDLALAGGVSIPLPQLYGYLYVPGMILSRDGHCRAFDADASGMVPGAGAGVVVLKRIEDALEDGDHIYAVIRGAAVNNDGAAKVGFTAPSVEGQYLVVRKSMEMAGFDSRTVRFIEAHGTGTEVGDPIEFSALKRAFESASGTVESCALGSLHTNIGHLDAAAGVAGLIKAALAVKHRTIPATLHFKKPNPLIDLANSPFYVNTSQVLYAAEEPFRAGVSSYGIGGTNAHVSIEEAPSFQSDSDCRPQLIPLSAKSGNALDRQISQLLQFLESEPNVNIADLSFTLGAGRRVFRTKQALVARDLGHLKEQLRSRTNLSEFRNRGLDHERQGPASVAFLFPGEGSQYVNMGRDLYATIPGFRKTVDFCASHLERQLGLDLRSVLYPPAGNELPAARLLQEPSIQQPALFTVEYAMSCLAMECGVAPAAMIGYGIGEYVAACVAGVFSLEDGLALVAERGRLIQSLSRGVMLAVSLSENDLNSILTERISIAAVDKPAQTVASGPEDEIARLESILRSKGVSCRRLESSHALHSAMMEPVIQRFVDYVTRVRLQAPSIPYIANVTGAWITAAQATDPAYWGAHLRNTVRFAEGAGTLLSDSYSIVLEVGPGESLPALISASDTRRGTAHLVETMRPAAKTVNDHEYWLTALAKLWVNNVRLDWKGIHAGQRRVRISLPTYPFERQRYWVERNGAVTPGAVAKTPGRKQDIADWFYLPSWKRTIPPPSKTVQPENWLVFAAESEFARAMTAGLRPRGRVFEVHAGSRFAVRSADCFELAPESREDYVSLLSQLASAGDLPQRILYEWQSDSPESCLTAVLYALQAIIENLPGVPIEFNLVTDCACSVFGERIISPAGGAVNAFCKVAPLENADFKVRTIDVDADTSLETMAQQVLRELEAEAQNKIVAYRHSSRWEQHFEPVRLGPSAESGIRLRPGGTYLITGGTGGVGLALAEYIARRTQGNLVLTGRSLIPAEEQWAALLAAPDTDAGLRNKILRLQRIREAGGQTTLLQADVADTNAMHRVMVEIQQRFGPVHGIIHAAAVVQPGLVQAKEPELMKSVLAPKVQGTAWLRSAIADGKLDFVLLCSSISSVLPTVGLADYAAANAWLDGLATELDSPLGTRVISVNWDAWRDLGRVADLTIPPYLVSRYRENLKYAIGSDEAAEIFDRLLNCPASQIVISTWDMHERMEISARFAQAASGELNHTLKSSQRAVTEFTGRDEEIDAEVIELWRELLGTTFIGANDNFFELGGHSLLAAQMLSRIRERFRINLPLKTIFEAATPAEIADRIRVMRWAISVPSQEQAETGEREEIEL